MADVHYNEERGGGQALQKALDTIHTMNPDFILIGGDIVYDVMRESSSDKAEALCRSFLSQISGIPYPVYYAIGNHEHFSLYNRKVNINHPLFGKKLYEKYFGKRYYSFDHKGWHFITLDDMVITPDRKYIGKVDSIQISWLKEDLAQIDDQTPIVVTAHVPLITTLSQWYGGGTNANTNKIAIENTDEVLNVFKNKNLKLILQGHIHYFEVLNILNKTTVISAPSFSGKWWMGKQHGMEEGFVRINITQDDQLEYEYIDYGWDPVEK
ncbi:metallophosphoesterase family protein [Limibacterium fermenti]|uniref:metallophosphoesterase family protein n=1 Tax=Limibacterium fermenti TaxID=3229863 RepID=UPI003A780E3F